ncbi:MAG: DUF1851 domain-containing protein [Deltaproteobacteria bacterium]|nr:DUF1851 domain-containing protein [Deltaproteobacteria bacterium]
MSHFRNFKKIHGPGLDCNGVSKKMINTYEDKLPLSLVEHWKSEGLCGYAKGLIWLVDPSEYEDILEEWLEPSSYDCIVFARTAFGDLYFWSNNKAYYLSVHYGKLKKITDDIEILFETVLCDHTVLEEVLMQTIYLEAYERLGPPKSDECYAFVPALALGGSRTAVSLQKVTLREHLGILVQLVGE